MVTTHRTPFIVSFLVISYVPAAVMSVNSLHNWIVLRKKNSRWYCIHFVKNSTSLSVQMNQLFYRMKERRFSIASARLLINAFITIIISHRRQTSTSINLLYKINCFCSRQPNLLDWGFSFASVIIFLAWSVVSRIIVTRGKHWKYA